MGGNLPSRFGTPLQTLQAAQTAFPSYGVKINAAASWYSTPPLGPPGQDDYINTVVSIETDLDAAGLLARLHEIEAAFERRRVQHWGPRTLDLDLIDFAGQVVLPAPMPAGEARPLTLPHPEMTARTFVLVPLAELAPSWRHPVSGRTALDLLEALPVSERTAIRRLG